MNVTGEVPFLEGRGRASSVNRMVDSYEENSYYQRSTSLPRQIDRPYEMKKTQSVRSFGDSSFIFYLKNSIQLIRN